MPYDGLNGATAAENSEIERVGSPPSYRTNAIVLTLRAGEEPDVCVSACWAEEILPPRLTRSDDDDGEKTIFIIKRVNAIALIVNAPNAFPCRHRLPALPRRRSFMYLSSSSSPSASRALSACLLPASSFRILSVSYTSPTNVV